MSSIDILIAHNAWRRGKTDGMDYATTREIGMAIDDAIEALQERHIARRSAVKMAGEIQRFRNAMAKATELSK